MDDKRTTTIRIKTPTPEQAALLRILSPDKKLEALIKAAQEEVAKVHSGVKK